jgi:hypothetical protein
MNRQTKGDTRNLHQIKIMYSIVPCERYRYISDEITRQDIKKGLTDVLL